MTPIAEPLPGCWLLEPHHSRDLRGAFVKTFSRSAFERLGLAFTAAEEYYSVSNCGVVRGMHFQLPPFDLTKLVYCARGRVLDVMLDLRAGSPTYRKAVGFELSSANRHQLFLPSGVAHGFRALEEDAMMVYSCSEEYAPGADAGIRWDSFGFDWGIAAPVLSERDRAFPELKNFVSPF